MQLIRPGAEDAPRRRILVIFNPTAGQRRASRLRDIVGALEARDAAVDVRETRCAGDARGITAACDRSVYDVIAVAGGDGTLNEVINGHRPSAPPVALIPFGTANVAAIELGIDRDPRRLAAMITGGPVRPAHLAHVNGRRFLLMAGIGFDAHVVEALSPTLKKRIGRAAYVAEVAAQLRRYRFPVFDIEMDGKKEQAVSLIVANGHHYGGPFVCAEAASFDTPELFACVFDEPGRLSVLKYGWRLLRGRLEGGAGYRVVPARRIAIDFPEDEPVQIDGDLGARLPIVIEGSTDTVPLVRAASHHA